LTVATLQAGAARELLDRDPEFARRALLAIEETSRGAMDDLDHVLGLLRERDPVTDRSAAGPSRAPQRTLADLDRLVADTRATGLPVTVEVSGPVHGLPAAVSREGYRIVQEGLTNAARHAGRAPVTLRIDVPDGVLDIDLVNAVTGGGAAARPGRGGRGLPGMRERVTLLGGRMTAGRDGEVWRVAVKLPVTDDGVPA
jgi:signal transduction histidine kinase